ncbi:hypothetical protein B4119_4075 [Parageobacillus caldoxylosilyticus]|uniref:Uncharacterized protein n=1 Tax=Saccharococcus caldoxylosilyticus TaxID=81408 RepID=A0A150M1Y8_9BACL|nr:hypothetical protein B4119_4075 [Parageobacillus caldoxylosilyticus]
MVMNQKIIKKPNFFKLYIDNETHFQLIFKYDNDYFSQLVFSYENNNHFLLCRR